MLGSMVAAIGLLSNACNRSALRGSAPDAGDAVLAVDAGGVPCGAARCTAGELCLACDADVRFIGCVKDDGTTGATAMKAVGCSGVAGVIMACDGPEDCAAGEACLMNAGENAYTMCQPMPQDFYARACHDNADCPLDRPQCSASAVSDLFTTYFDMFRDLLAWEPRACGPAR
jgi:hypothetical protein